MQSRDLVWVADSFGKVIRKAREAQGMTQKELAKPCHISPMYISQIEKWDRIPQVKICRLLAKALDLEESRLLLLAYRTKAPKEIKDLLLQEGLEPDGDQLDSRFKSLLQIISTLPKDQQNRVAKILEDSLELLRC